MRFGSLFSGVGGIDLDSSVAAPGVEDNPPFADERHSNFFELVVPEGVGFAVGDYQVFGTVVVLIEINVMHELTAGERPVSLSGSNHDMLCYVATLSRIRVRGIKNVVVAVAERGSFSALAFCFGAENPATFPSRVQLAALVAFRRNPGRNAHLLHSSPHDFLSGAVFLSYLLLAHAEFHVIAMELLLSERNAVCVHIAHRGIIPDASNVLKGGDAICR